MALYGNQSSKFVVDLLQKLYVKEHNLVLSPYSLTTALTMLLVGTDKGSSSRLQLVKAIFDDNNDSKTDNADQHVEAFVKCFNANLEKNQDTLVVGNMLYSAKSFPLKLKFVSTLSEEFHAVAKQLDFSDAATVETINSDVSKATKGLITKLLDSIDASTCLILVNAIYFKGLWDWPFQKQQTNEKGEFHLSSGQTVQAALMSKTRGFAFFDDVQQTKAKAVELNYQSDGNISMVFILPCKGVSLESFIGSLTGKKLDNILRNLYHRSNLVSLVLPRFKLSAQHELEKILREIGIKDVFDGSKASLGNISPNSQGLALSEVIQKAVIEVNEERTEAAAATRLGAIMGCCEAPPKPLEFIANRPFLYVLATKDKPRQILFIGAVEDPNKSV